MLKHLNSFQSRQKFVASFYRIFVAIVRTFFELYRKFRALGSDEIRRIGSISRVMLRVIVFYAYFIC